MAKATEMMVKVIWGSSLKNTLISHKYRSEGPTCNVAAVHWTIYQTRKLSLDKKVIVIKTDYFLWSQFSFGEFSKKSGGGQCEMRISSPVSENFKFFKHLHEMDFF